MRVSLLALALMGSALPAFADEVNVYSHRQPELIQPLIDAFTAETGIVVNVAFVEKGRWWMQASPKRCNRMCWRRISPPNTAIRATNGSA